MSRKVTPLRVLVVDDEALIRWFITETLTERGHRVIEAADAAAARRALTNATDAPDVVLLDYRLPDSNGLELLAALRRLSPQSGVVLMTAFGTPEVLDGANALGVCRVMQKPFDMDDIAHAVEQAHPQCVITATHQASA